MAATMAPLCPGVSPAPLIQVGLSCSASVSGPMPPSEKPGDPTRLG